VVVGRLQPRVWTAEDGSARFTVEVVAEELGPSLRWATAMPARITKGDREERLVWSRSGLGGQADQAGEKHEEHEEAAQQEEETEVQVLWRGGSGSLPSATATSFTSPDAIEGLCRSAVNLGPGGDLPTNPADQT
jgi:single-stranded DNA-binding protein